MVDTDALPRSKGFEPLAPCVPGGTGPCSCGEVHLHFSLALSHKGEKYLEIEFFVNVFLSLLFLPFTFLLSTTVLYLAGSKVLQTESVLEWVDFSWLWILKREGGKADEGRENDTEMGLDNFVVTVEFDMATSGVTSGVGVDPINSRVPMRKFGLICLSCAGVEPTPPKMYP